jgi:DNA-directed RNA polymerase subunit RPC12/RpoP
MKKVVLSCSKCGAKIEGQNKSFYEAAMDEGWSYDMGRYLCGKCSGKKVEKKKPRFMSDEKEDN